MSPRLRVGVLFGGRSTEHEVSVLSAQSIIAALDPERYEVVPLYIDKEGHWLLGDSIPRLVHQAAARTYVYLPPDPTQHGLVPASLNGAPPASPGSVPPLDVVFPVFHGLNELPESLVEHTQIGPVSTISSPIRPAPVAHATDVPEPRPAFRNRLRIPG